VFRLIIPQGSKCTYWSHRDEAAFFAWLQAIPGVVNYQGTGTDLVVTLKSKRLSRVALWELIALHTRYRLPMRSLAQFETPTNRSWFRSKKMHWHSKVFG
jgi:hypothetical protein